MAQSLQIARNCLLVEPVPLDVGGGAGPRDGLSVVGPWAGLNEGLGQLSAIAFPRMALSTSSALISEQTESWIFHVAVSQVRCEVPSIPKELGFPQDGFFRSWGPQEPPPPTRHLEGLGP